MRSVEDLPTPAVLVDLDVLERNIARMAERARAAGVRLRPHAKTHKVLEIGRMQLAQGAAGLSLAKVGEAEVFAAAGFRDLFLAYPTVGAERGRRLLALSDDVRLAVGATRADRSARRLRPSQGAETFVGGLLTLCVDCFERKRASRRRQEKVLRHTRVPDVRLEAPR